jgi:integrase
MRIVWFRDRWHAYERVDGVPRRISLSTTDRAAAERLLRDIETSRKRKAVTVAQMYQDYLTDRAPQLASQETLRFAWMRLAPVFGHLRPDQITRALTRSYAARETGRGIGPSSIRRDLGVLSAVVRYNDKQSPAVIEMPAPAPPRSLHLTREEYRALRDASKSVPHLYVFVVLAYSTAGRASAILELTWDRVDFDHRLIQLGYGEARVKGRATVPMTEVCHVTLEEARRSSISDYVVEYAGRRVRSVKRAFKAAVERAGLRPEVSPHVLRHSAAVHMAESGVPMSEISQYLGHTSTGVTERVYARFSTQYLRKAANALE